MKKLLEKQIVFSASLKVLAFLAQRKGFDKLTGWATAQAAKLNLLLNRPTSGSSVEELAHTWQELMPPDGRKYFPIKEIDEQTAYTEIHLHCPLRGTGNVEACYKLMNYDRTLMANTGGELIVLESQSNSGKKYCKLAIRVKGADTDDLTPAHLSGT
ncbi:MAG: hypothetical protein AAFY71_04615 [Bacteroidota bacterium]